MAYNYWNDYEVYHAVLETDNGDISRLFSIDSHYSREDIHEQILEHFPRISGIKSLDSWGTAFGLKERDTSDELALVEALEKKFALMVASTSQQKADHFRDFMSQLELHYSSTLFNQHADSDRLPERLLYNKIKAARDQALIKEYLANQLNSAGLVP